MTGTIADILFDQTVDTSITDDEMERFAAIAWGDLGREVVRTWRDYNARYFDGALEPVPIILVNSSPYGKWTAQTVTCKNRVRRIEIVMPEHGSVDPANRGTLLHEMVHQYLFERDEDSDHESDGWCREIVRLSALLGRKIWASPGDARSRSKRSCCPETGIASLPGNDIALWPSSLGLELARFDNHIMMQDIRDDDDIDRFIARRQAAMIPA